MVVPVTSSDLVNLNKQLAANLLLAQGYNTLYQGQPATGLSPGIAPPTTNVFNGDLATVEGTGPQPGSPTATTAFLPPGTAPSFPSPIGETHPGESLQLPGPRHRRSRLPRACQRVAHSLGRGNSIRGDLGQPITIGSIAQTGTGVTINSPGGGSLTIGQNLIVGDNATILGDATIKSVIGDNVNIGGGAVVEGTSLGSGSTVGARALLINSTFPAGTQIPPGAIYENNTLVGYVAW